MDPFRIDAEIARQQQVQHDYPATADSLNPLIFQLLKLKLKIKRDVTP